jgi:hypothetical protein
MGQIQHTPAVKSASRRFPPRTCLRKGCGEVFQPARWNQRYCREAHCLLEVRRWQAAKRQRAYRQSAENRKRHAEAEARRRRAKKEAANAAEGSTNTRSEEAVPGSPPKSTRGGAWSRSNKIPEDFCDRPGCYEPLPADSRAPARYCGGDCRQAMRRVRDRERKWLIRNGDASTTQRRDKASAVSKNESMDEWIQDDTMADARYTRSQESAHRVGDYRNATSQTLSSLPVHDPPLRSVNEDDDSKTSSHRRSRPPPTG